MQIIRKREWQRVRRRQAVLRDAEPHSRFRGARESAATRTARSCPQPMKGQLRVRQGSVLKPAFGSRFPGQVPPSRSPSVPGVDNSGRRSGAALTVQEIICSTGGDFAPVPRSLPAPGLRHLRLGLGLLDGHYVAHSAS